MTGVVREPKPELAFVAPSLYRTLSGGTLYNRELVVALSEHLTVRLLGPDADPRAAGSSRYVLIDSLFLAQVPELTRRLARPVAILLHYLPSFVALGRAAARAELSDEERAALDCASALWVPSAFMRDALEAIVAPPQKIFVLEPGTRARSAAERATVQAPVRALSVGNVTPGKGYLELLRALAKVLEPADAFELRVLGSVTADAAYAQACFAELRANPALAERVSFAGEVSPKAVMDELADADVFVSASRMESYGMALAEARHSGVPIAALEGGNVHSHVVAECGGKLARNQGELATLLLGLVRSPALLHECCARARAHAPPPRAWAHVALEFAAQLAKCEK